MKIRRATPILCSLTAAGLLLSACGESRLEKLRRENAYAAAGSKGVDRSSVKEIPPYPMQEQLRPLLEHIYSGEKLPAVFESEDVVEGDYIMSAGVLAKIKLKPGLSGSAAVKAIIHGTAEADAWVPRDGARRTYAEQINKVKNSFKEEKDLVLAAYGDLKLLAVFNNPDTAAILAALPADVSAGATAMAAEYSGQKEDIWNRWMGVKMYARRAVAGDEPFKSLLRDIRRSIGVKEPAPLTWEDSHGPKFTAYANTINKDDTFFAAMTNLRELKDQELFRGDTHALWLMEGSDKIPEKAKDAKQDPALGFAVYREDLGGGFQEMTFVFSKKLSGPKLKYAYLRSHVYRHLFSDFQLLATAGGDYKGDIVPDKHDQVYAYCGSQAAVDSFIIGYKSKYPFLSDVKASTDKEDKILTIAHDCVIERASPDVKVVDPDNEMDVEGSAPGSRLGLFQMLARFENSEVDIKGMLKEAPKSQGVLDAEAFLKANKNKQN